MPIKKIPTVTRRVHPVLAGAAVSLALLTVAAAIIYRVTVS
jgi:hypothetical protein